MDATRWMPRIGAACAVLMLLVLAVPAGAVGAPSTVVVVDATDSIVFNDPSGNTDRIRVEEDPNSSQVAWFGFHNAGGDNSFLADNGCTVHNGVRICPPRPDAQRFVFQLAGGADLVDLSHPELTFAFVLDSTVDGGDGADELRGGLRGDEFSGGAGDDKLVGLAGSDRFTGGGGTDTLELSAGGPWVVTLDGNINDGPAGAPQASVAADVEVLLGGTQADALAGAAGAQTISGGGGADTLDGGPDADTIEGGAGGDTIAARDGAVDTVACGEGADTVTADWNDAVAPDCESVARSVRDDDGDGSANGVDCNDANGAIKPGAGDVPGNGVDEDCDGSDAVLDRDGDGAAAGVDCDDANPARRPGAREIPANGVDEDCSGKDARRTAVAAKFTSGWSVFTDGTVITKLRVTGAPRGAKLRVTCKGKGCPFARKAVKLKQGTASLTKRFRAKRLRPGAVIELRVTAAGRIGKVQRITIRHRKDPKRVTLCLAPGASKPKKCG